MASSILIINPTGAQLTKVRKAHPAAHIICGANYRLNYLDHPAVDQFYLLDKFLPPDFESQLLAMSEEVVQSLLNITELQELFRLDGQDILRDGRFHYMTQNVYPIARAALQIHKLLEAHPEVEMAYADGNYIDVLRALNVTVRRLSRRNLLRSVAVRLISFAAVIYKLIYVPIRSRLGYRGTSFDPQNKTILIGNINEFVQFKDELAPNIPLRYDRFLILHPMRKYSRFKQFKGLYPDSYSFYPLDALLKASDYLKVFLRYLRLAFKIPKILRDHYSPTLYSGDISVALHARTLRFFYFFSLVAMKNYYAMERLLQCLDETPQVLFSHPHTFLMNSANNYLRRRGVKTMTYNHGLIQSPLQLITETWRNHSVSAYDLAVMEKLSQDDEYVHIPMNLKTEQINLDFQAEPNLLILGNTFTSSELFEYSMDYLSCVKEGLKKAGLDSQIPSYKPHPKENQKKLKAYLEKIDFPVKILRSDLNAALKGCNLVITPISTALMECNKRGIPFLVYRYHAESLETFFSEIPESILFDDSEEFYRKYGEISSLPEAELTAIYNGLLQRYYRGNSAVDKVSN